MSLAKNIQSVRILLSGALWLLACPLSASPTSPADVTPPPPLAAPADVGGLYLTRTEDNGAIIHGSCHVERKADVYLFEWLAGGTHSQGIGIRQGDMIAVSWWLADGKLRGVTVYRVDGDKLVGRWASVPGGGRLQRETLFWLRALPAQVEAGE